MSKITEKNVMAKENENGNQGAPTVEVSENFTNLVSAMEGLPGAEQILQDTGKEAVEKGIIKVPGQASAAAPAANNSAANGNNGQQQAAAEEEEEGSENEEGKDGKKKTAAPVENGQQQAAAEEEEEEEEEDELTEEELNNPLLSSVKGKKAAKNDIVFENFDQIKAHTKKHFGIDVKSEKDFAKFFQSATTWRAKAQAADELTEKVAQFEGLFDNMPAPLLESVKAWAAGDAEWHTHVNQNVAFDFSKPADKQDEKALVNHYFPGKFTDADWAEETRPQGLDIALSSSKKQYTTEKREVEQKSADMIQKSNERIARVKTSVAGSLNTLKASFPDLDTKGLKEISRILESGDINSIFFDKNGSYKPEAAEMLLMAKYGKETIKKLMKVSAKRAETAANEDILTRGADKPRPQKGGAQHKQVDEKTQKAINALVGGLNPKKTY